MSQWKSYDIFWCNALYTCPRESTAVSKIDFNFLSGYQLCQQHWKGEIWMHLNFLSSYLLYLYFASIRAIFGVPACQIGKVVVVLLRAANMSAIPEFQAFSLSRDQSLHPDNTEKTPKRAGVLVQIQNWVSSVWKEKISSNLIGSCPPSTSLQPLLAPSRLLTSQY